MEMHLRRRTSGERSSTSSTVIVIDWMCRPAKSTDVGDDDDDDDET